MAPPVRRGPLDCDEEYLLIPSRLSSFQHRIQQALCHTTSTHHRTHSDIVYIQPVGILRDRVFKAIQIRHIAEHPRQGNYIGHRKITLNPYEREIWICRKLGSKGIR